MIIFLFLLMPSLISNNSYRLHADYIMRIHVRYLVAKAIVTRQGGDPFLRGSVAALGRR